MARQIACNAYIIMIIIYYKVNVYITRRLSKLFPSRERAEREEKVDRGSKNKIRRRFLYWIFV